MLWKVAMGTEYCNASFPPPDEACGGCAPSSTLAHSWSTMYEVKKENPTDTGITSHTLQAYLWMFTSSGENKTKTNTRACEINQSRQVWRNTGQTAICRAALLSPGGGAEDVIVTKYPSLPLWLLLKSQYPQTHSYYNFYFIGLLPSHLCHSSPKHSETSPAHITNF